MKSDLRVLESRLGYRFRSVGLLEEALTHSSLSSGQGLTNERLEFLGDRVLGLVVAEELFRVFGDKDEGALSQLSQYLVSGEFCASVGKALALQDYLKMAPVKKGVLLERMLARALGDACEALVAALYLDGGLDVARAFILRHWNITEALEPRLNPKNQLQEWALAHHKVQPVYECIGKTGTDNMPDFTVRVCVGTMRAVTAQGPSRRKAETSAAQRFIEHHKLDISGL